VLARGWFLGLPSDYRERRRGEIAYRGVSESRAKTRALKPGPNIKAWRLWPISHWFRTVVQSAGNVSGVNSAMTPFIGETSKNQTTRPKVVQIAATKVHAVAARRLRRRHSATHVRRIAATSMGGPTGAKRYIEIVLGAEPLRPAEAPLAGNFHDMTPSEAKSESDEQQIDKAEGPQHRHFSGRTVKHANTKEDI